MTGIRTKNGTNYAKYAYHKGASDITEEQWKCKDSGWRRLNIHPSGSDHPNYPAVTCDDDMSRPGGDGRTYKNMCQYEVPCKWVEVARTEYRNYMRPSWLDRSAQ